MIAFTVTVTTPFIQTLTVTLGSIVSYSYVSRVGFEYALAMKQGLVFGFSIRPAVEQ